MKKQKKAMNKIIKTVMILLLLPLSVARAEDVLQVKPFATTAGVEEGSDETFSIEMVNTQAYTALEFNLYLPEGMSLLMNSEDYDPMELSSERFPGKTRKGVFIPNHDTDIKQMSDGRYYIKIYNTDLETIDGTEGELLIFYYETAADMAPGYYPITITGTILGVDSHTGVYPVTSTSFVKIGEPEKFDASILKGYIPSFVASDIPTDETAYDFRNVDEMGATFTPANPNAVLYVKAESAYAATATGNVVTEGVCPNLVISDGYPFAAPIAFTANQATYERTAPNAWGTLCLPYATESTAEVQLYQLKDIQSDLFVFDAVDALAAGEPGVFQRLNDGTTIKMEATNAAIATNVAEGPTTQGMEIVGTYAEKRIAVEESNTRYYIKNNTFCAGVEYFTVPAFRAYFKSEQPSGYANFRITTSNEATGIEVIGSLQNAVSSDWYSTNGLKLNLPAQKGIYIQKGKKYLVK